MDFNSIISFEEENKEERRESVSLGLASSQLDALLHQRTIRS